MGQAALTRKQGGLDCVCPVGVLGRNRSGVQLFQGLSVHPCGGGFMRILVVEDDVLIAVSIRQLLQEASYAVDVEHDAIS